MIEVEVFGNEGVPKHRSNISGYSYAEEATPISPGDSSGGVGTLSFTTMDEDTTSALIFRDEIYLTDSQNGSISGRVTSIDATDGVVTFNGVSNLSRLNIVGNLPIFSGTLTELITLVLNTAGVYSGIDIDTSFDAVNVVSPAYDGDLWVFIKDICTAYELEIALVQDTLTVRPLRQNTIKLFDVMSDGWAINDIQPAQYVDVNYYNYSVEESFLAYPKGGWTKETQVYQVDALQELVVELPVSAYLDYVEQPVVKDTVGRYDDSASAYCVAGNDGLPIPANQWTDFGGDLSFELANNGQTIIVTITGANIPDLAPFRIAVATSQSDYYSSLRIVGSGVAYDKKTLRQPTGLTEDDTSNVLGITIDNKLIDTHEQAHDAAKRAILPYALPLQVYRFSAPSIGDFLTTPGQILYTLFYEYDNTLEPGEIFTEVDAGIGLIDFETFDNLLPTSIVDGISQQMFGNVSGARVKFRDSWYRVKAATITPTSVDAEAHWDNLISDLNAANTGETFATFNGTFEELTFTDFSIIPMRTT